MTRKVPIHTPFQEVSKLILMLLLILGYMLYDFIDYLTFFGYIGIGIIALAFIVFFIKTLKNMVVVTIEQSVMLSKKNPIKKNNLYFIISNVIMVLCTFSHFGLRFYFEKDLTPLIWEYGIGGIVAAVFFILLNRNPLCSVTHIGMAIGSKTDLKIIPWDAIHFIENLENTFVINCIKNYPIKKINIVKNSKTIDLKRYIESKISKI